MSKCLQKIKCEENEQMLWSDHCVQDTTDAGFVEYMTMKKSDILVQKGTNMDVDSYSAFMNNTEVAYTTLHNTLKEGLKDHTDIKTIVLVGIAEDVCVASTASHGKTLGYNVILVSDASAGTSNDGEATAEAKLQGEGIQIVTTKDLLEIGRGITASPKKAGVLSRAWKKLKRLR